MSSGKKGKKTKGKSISLGEFLGSSNSSNSSQVVLSTKPSWAEESEDFEEDRYGGPSSIVLPTAPRQARSSEVDLERVPSTAPFIAFVANLPFDAEEEDIKRFFLKLNVLSVRLPREGGDAGRFKGFAYVEFENRNDLVEALSLNDDMIRNRKIRVDVADEDGNRKTNQRGGDRDEEREDRSGGISDWRAAPREAAPPRGDRSPDRRFDDRPGFNDRDRNFGRERDRDRFDNRDGGRFGGGGGRFDDRDRRGYDDRRGGFEDRRGGGGDFERRTGGGFDDRKAGGAGGGGFSRDRGYDDRRGGGFDDRRGGGGGFDDRRGGGGYGRRGDDFDRKDDDRFASRGNRDDTQTKERPKLNLKPRTKAGEEVVEKPSGANPSIFGAAKPVDTAARDQLLEKKFKDPAAPVAKKEAPAAAAVDIFGAAKPVDTAAREREIEEKLKKRQDVSPRNSSYRDERRGDERRGDERRGDEGSYRDERRGDEGSYRDERRSDEGSYRDERRSDGGSYDSKRGGGGGYSQDRRERRREASPERHERDDDSHLDEREEAPPKEEQVAEAEKDTRVSSEDTPPVNGNEEDTNATTKNIDNKKQKKSKKVKDETVILNTTNKFSQLGLDEEEV